MNWRCSFYRGSDAPLAGKLNGVRLSLIKRPDTSLLPTSHFSLPPSSSTPKTTTTKRKSARSGTHFTPSSLFRQSRSRVESLVDLGSPTTPNRDKCGFPAQGCQGHIGRNCQHCFQLDQLRPRFQAANIYHAPQTSLRRSFRNYRMRGGRLSYRCLLRQPRPNSAQREAWEKPWSLALHGHDHSPQKTMPMISQFTGGPQRIEVPVKSCQSCLFCSKCLIYEHCSLANKA